MKTTHIKALSSDTSLNGTRGVTLVELLVVLLILSLLATAAVPVFLSRVEDARRTTAIQEVEEIAKAQKICALAHGVYVPLQILDDLPEDPVTTTGRDDVTNSAATGTVSLILVTSRAEDQVGNQPNLADTFGIGQNTRQGWRGPFLNPQRVFTDGLANEEAALDNTRAARDFPLDPYGNPYRFYSPIGLVGTGAQDIVTNINTNSFSNGILTTTDDRFDRYAIVSYGPDGLSNENTSSPTDDDIVYQFGFNPSESTFSPF